MRQNLCLAVIFFLTYLQGPANAAEEGLSPYVQHVTSDAITICWHRAPPAPGAVHYGKTAALGQIVESKVSVAWQKVRLKGLEPSTEYHYKVVAGGGSSPPRTFRTARQPGEPLRFVVWGDSNQITEPVAMAPWFAKEQPDFIVSLGDQATESSVETSVERYKGVLEKNPELYGRVPWYVLFGNHDTRPGLRQVFEVGEVEPPPAGKPNDTLLYWSCRLGDAHFIGIDYGHGIHPGDKGSWSRQAQWLEKELAQARKTAPFIFLFLHSVDGDARKSEKRKAYFERMPADVIFWATAHMYERVEAVKPDGSGLLLNTSGGGAPLRAVRTTPVERSAALPYVRSDFHFVAVELHKGVARFRAIDKRGNEFDRFFIVRDEGFEKARRETFLTSAEPIEKAEALRDLAGLNQDMTQELRRALASEAVPLKAAGALGLVRTRDAQARAALLAKVKDPEVAVRRAVALALEWQGTEKDLPAATDLAADRDPLIEVALVHYFIRHPAPAGRRLLDKAAQMQFGNRAILKDLAEEILKKLAP